MLKGRVHTLTVYAKKRPDDIVWQLEHGIFRNLDDYPFRIKRSREPIYTPTEAELADNLVCKVQYVKE